MLTMSLTLLIPRSSRMFLTEVYSRASSGSPNCLFASTVSTPFSYSKSFPISHDTLQRSFLCICQNNEVFYFNLISLIHWPLPSEHCFCIQFLTLVKALNDLDSCGHAREQHDNLRCVIQSLRKRPFSCEH